MPQPQDSQDQVEGELDQVGRPPRAGEDGDGDDQRADRGADTVGAVQQVQQPPPAGQGHRGVQPGVHHAGRHARQRRHGEHQPQPGGQREPGVAQRRDRAGHGEQGRHAQAPHQRADERGDQHGTGRGEEQDQTEVTDRRAEGGAHRRPRGAEHAIGEPEDDEAAEAEQIGTPAGRGRPMLLTHWSMYTQRPADRVNRAQLVPLHLRGRSVHNDVIRDSVPGPRREETNHGHAEHGHRRTGPVRLQAGTRPVAWACSPRSPPGSATSRS